MQDTATYDLYVPVLVALIGIPKHFMIICINLYSSIVDKTIEQKLKLCLKAYFRILDWVMLDEEGSVVSAECLVHRALKKQQGYSMEAFTSHNSHVYIIYVLSAENTFQWLSKF